MNENRNKNRGIYGRLALFATAIIWGTSFVVLKAALDHIGIFWILTIRFGSSALLLIAIGGKKLRHLNRRSLLGGALMGACLAAAYIFQTLGLARTTPGKNAFLTATYCVLVPFLAWLFYKRRPDLSNILAAMLCICGIGFVSLSGGESNANLGDALTLCCGVFYAMQILLAERYGSESDTLSLSAVQFTIAALVCLAGALLFEQPPRGLGAASWLSIAYLSLACTCLCFFLETWGLQYTPSATAAVIMTLEAVFGALTSVLFYHEPMTGRLILGFALIFVSVLISETKPKFLQRKQNA